MSSTETSQSTPAVNPVLAARALYIIVFVSGAVLMGLEIAGAKVLAPSFGTSTFVWGAIIGMFMGALAAGYYWGGHLADKRPSFQMLAIIVCAAAVWIFALPRFGPSWAEGIARMNIHKVFDPLLASMLLFFVPSFLMGMVSPYSVKLNASSLAGVGGVAGRLYALSTFGSIIGTWLTTFVLIPIMKLSNVLQLLGALLLLTAIACLSLFIIASGKFKRPQVQTVGILILVWLIGTESWAAFPLLPKLTGGDRLIHYDDSPYHEIMVCEQVIYYDETSPDDKDGGRLLPCKLWDSEPWIRRWLKFNDNIESGTYPYHEKHLNAVTYTDLLHVPLLWVKEPKRILVVGGGGGIIPTQYYNWYGSQVDIAEIDSKVAEVAQEFFDMPRGKDGKLATPPPGGGPGITFFIGDGRQTIRHDLKDERYDVIVLDAYSSGGQIPFHLMTRDFLEEVKGHLKPEGVLITNIISSLQNGNSSDAQHSADLFLAEYKTLSSTRWQARGDSGPASDPADNEPLFKQLYVFPKFYEDDEKMTEGKFEEYRNVIIVATNEATRKPAEDGDDSMETLAVKLAPKTEGLKEYAEIEKAIDSARVRCDLKAIVKNYKKLRGYRIPSEDALKGAVILTDDYAPVDLMYRPVKRDEFTRRIR